MYWEYCLNPLQVTWKAASFERVKSKKEFAVDSDCSTSLGIWSGRSNDARASVVVKDTHGVYDKTMNESCSPDP